MTGEQILDIFFEMVDDEELTEDTAYSLMNNAEFALENEREWVILRAKDKSITHSSSDTWETPHDLPANFNSVRSMFALSESGNTRELFPISFDDLEKEQHTPDRYAIDYANKKIYFTGVYNQSVTIINNYKKFAETIDADTQVVWPKQTGVVIAFRMAELYFGGIDGDDVNFQMTPKQEEQYEAAKSQLFSWDANLQYKEMNGQAGMNWQIKR